jgi:hypothetical protein
VPTPLLGTAAMVLMFPYMVYRRVKNHIGRQKLNPRRLKLRIGIMLVLLALFGVPAQMTLDPEAAAALLGGSLAGFLLSRFALGHTTFALEGEAQYYVPNPWIGMSLTSLLLARMAWRMWQMYPLFTQADGAVPPAFGPLTPLTLLMLASILSYNAAYLLGILTHPAKPAAAG